MPLTIDGSTGEGGGQILRTAIALSAIKQTAVRIVNIRKSRPRPGLGVQHIKSIEIARDMTDANVEGLHPGSSDVTFSPGQIKAGDFTINMGTAGSITLALQSVLPIAAFAPGPITLDITGGTDVKWSPPYDYFKNVTKPALGRFGFHMEASLLARGYFPLGGGRVIIKTMPASLRGAELMAPDTGQVNGVSASSRLPRHVCERQAKAASGYLNSRGFEPGEIRLDVRDDVSTGSSITLFRGYMGGSDLGERGKPAEKVGRDAAASLASGLNSGAAVDQHLADQLVIYMALAGEPSAIKADSVTLHAMTGIAIVEQMTDSKFTIEKVGKTVIIRSSGIRAV